MTEENKDARAAIKNYWEDPSTRSIIDKNLHTIEIDAVRRHLVASDRVADIGCGEGVATMEYARMVRECVAFERSNHLRGLAKKRLAETGLSNVTVLPGDLLKMNKGAGDFDAVVSQRMLINLASWEEQQEAILNIRSLLKPSGRFIMIENTVDATDAMNDVRKSLGLSPIKTHWHNLYFDYDQMISFMKKHFEVVEESDFGLYYFLTRIYVSMFASFTGFGVNAKKNPIFDTSDEAARKLFEAYGGQWKLNGIRAFGPIQCFVFLRPEE